MLHYFQERLFIWGNRWPSLGEHTPEKRVGGVLHQLGINDKWTALSSNSLKINFFQQIKNTNLVSGARDRTRRLKFAV